MRSIDDYLDLARMRGNFSSDTKLAHHIGITSASISAFRKGRSWPKEETILRIANLANLDPEAALLELEVWKAATPEVRAVFEGIARKLIHSAAVAFMAAGVWSANPAEAGTHQERFHQLSPSIINYATIDIWSAQSPPHFRYALKSYVW